MHNVTTKKWMLIIISLVLVLVATPLFAACGDDDEDEAIVTMTTEPTTTAEPTTPEPTGTLLTIDSKLGDLMENPDCKAILEKHLPDTVMNSPRLMTLGARLTIPQIAGASEGLITDEMLNAITEELEELGAYSTTAAATPAPTKTASKLTGEPVKIGVLAPWSGSMGIAGLMLDQCLKVADYLIEERGGILGGRPVKWEKHDTKGEIAHAQAGIKKLAGDSDVIAITIGGATAGEINASTIATTEEKIPYFSMGTWKKLPEYPYAVRSGTVNNLFRTEICAEYALDNLSPKTVAFLAENTDDCHDSIGHAKEIFEAAGVEVVYEQYYPYDITDLSPYLTRIKGKEPDLFFHFIANATSVQSMFKQIIGLGGWGDMEVIGVSSHPGDLANEKGAQGTYFWAYWLPGLPYAGAKKFEQAWQAVHGDRPNNIHTMLFTTIWSAVEAVDQAGADREAIADHIRSGTFGFDSPGGPLVIGTDGEPNIKGIIAMVKEGEAIPAP